MKLILAVLIFAMGIWLAFNKPELAQQVLGYVQYALAVALDFIRELMNK